MYTVGKIKVSFIILGILEPRSYIANFNKAQSDHLDKTQTLLNTTVEIKS
jgi:hypothetical protein